jgi:hypothetical protein
VCGLALHRGQPYALTGRRAAPHGCCHASWSSRSIKAHKTTGKKKWRSDVTTGIGKSREENQTAPGRAAPAHVAVEDKGAVVHTHTLAVKKGHRSDSDGHRACRTTNWGGATAFRYCVPWERGRRSGTGPTKTIVCARACREDPSRARAAASCRVDGENEKQNSFRQTRRSSTQRWLSCCICCYPEYGCSVYKL